MKLPREIKGIELAKRLKVFGYKITRQTGPHIRLTTKEKGEHHITIPAHQTLKVGTLNGIIKSISEHFDMPSNDIIKKLF